MKDAPQDRDKRKSLSEVDARLDELGGSSLNGASGQSPFAEQRQEPAPSERERLPPAMPAGYEYLGKLSQGNMGRVYRVRQTLLHRYVALKMILKGRFANPEELARFRTEAEAIACLQHPHIVRVYGSGEHEGQPFFVMEFVDGCNLAQKLDGKPLRRRWKRPRSWRHWQGPWTMLTRTISSTAT
jgi:serine/threonine protein kinase